MLFDDFLYYRFFEKEHPLLSRRDTRIPAKVVALVTRELRGVELLKKR